MGNPCGSRRLDIALVRVYTYRMSSSKSVRLTDKQISLIAKALAEPRRYQILRDIGKCKDQMACSALKEMNDISAATLSHHIKELETAGLVTTAKDGKFMKLTVERDILHAYLDHLSKI